MIVILIKKLNIIPIFSQGWGAGYFLTAPAPDFFFKRLLLQGDKNTGSPALVTNVQEIVIYENKVTFKF